MQPERPESPWTAEELAAVPDAPPPIRWASVARIALGVAAGVIAAALVVVPAASWWEGFHRPSSDGLASKVADSITDSMNSDAAYQSYGITVPNVTLVPTGENTYTGQATIKPSSGESHQVSVTVMYDGEYLMWETKPGAFAWLSGA